MTDQAKDAESIFGAAIQIPSSDDRAAFLNEACGGDRQLRAEVEKLVIDHFRAGSFLEQPAVQVDASTATPWSAEPIGNRIGPYKLLQQVGEGGMGVVYLAEQVQPVKRRVAVKIIKHGMDTRQFVARFEAERQALAMMDHPNIARVLDAGCTETGRPYFVMEFVKGVPLTKFCDENRLTARERVELFVSVCHAVQHAHQKGIIHRDLKPSNVLVALYDDRPVPKVIDFGVAKATNQQLTEKTLFTQVGQIVGTWEYMSPEQAVLNQLDVDTRTDIYSLGVILYELLTGVTPLEPQRLRSAALEDLLRLIREEEPPKPSTRISSLGAAASATAAFRRTDVASLARTVRGDVDWIVMKALEKNRSRRYETANSLAADLNRYLSGEAIEARPPSTVYRVRRAIARHRMILSALTAVLLAMMIGTTVSVWLAMLWRQEKVAAEVAKKDFEALTKRAWNLVVEKSLLCATAADVAGVDEAMQGYEEKMGAGDDKWLRTFRGACYAHRGEFEQAIALLEPVVQASPDNVAAAGMMAWACLESGRWDDGMHLAQQLKDRTPQGEFKDFDLLFQAYGVYFLDYEQSVRNFRDVVERRPAWGAARLMLAHSLGHLAENSDRLDCLDEAVQEINIARALIKENAWVLSVRLFVDLKVIQLRRKHGLSPDTWKESLEDALAVAQTLRRDYADNTLGNWVMAGFYDTIDDENSAGEIWRRLLHAPGDFSYCSLGWLYRNQTSKDTLETITQLGSDHPLIRAAEACIMADIPAKRREAFRIYQELRDQPSSAFVHGTVILIPLLLGETDEAVRQCQTWMHEYQQGMTARGDTESVAHDKFFLELIAGGPVTTPKETMGTDLLREFGSEYAQGLLALSQGDRDSARAHFEACVRVGHVRADVVWARAFIAHINGDPDWPRANKSLHPDVFR